MTAHLPVVIFALIGLCITLEILSAVRESRRPPSPEWGCCGCGADECDVLVGPAGEAEGYCWTCVDTWPADATPAVELGVSVFPGRERDSR